MTSSTGPSGTPEPTFVRRAIEWLRAGYPQGVPRTDYVALLGVLHRSCTEDEVQQIVDELAAASSSATPITSEEIRRLIRDRLHEEASNDDVLRVSQHLLVGGWPLAGREVDEDSDDDPAPGSFLARVVAWLREGYPTGIPQNDYIAVLAVLQRRLTKAEVKRVAKTLSRQQVSPVSEAAISEAIHDLISVEPASEDLERVRARLAKKGWPLAD